MDFLVLSFLFLVFVIGGAVAGLYWYRRSKYHKRQVEQSMKLVPLRVSVPRDMGEKENQGMRNQTDLAREMIASAENMYTTIFGLYSGGNIKKKVKNFIYRSPHISLEIIAHKKEIFFYVLVPYEYLTLIERSITAQFPDAEVKRTEEPNIFQPGKKLQGVTGGDIWGFKNYYYPIKTYQEISDEPLEALTNAFSMLEEDEGAALQVLIRPVEPEMMTSAKSLIKKIQKGPAQKPGLGIGDVMKEVASPGANAEAQKAPEPYRTTPLEEQIMKDVEKKSSKFGYETRIRFIVAARDNERAKLVFGHLKSALAQYSDLHMNGLRIKRSKNISHHATNYIFRYFDDRAFGGERFWPTKRGFRLVLSTEELATIYHFPNMLVKTPGIHWLPAKSQQIPTNLPLEGIKFAKTAFRTDAQDVKITPYDLMRHVYVIGQTGTGKTVLLLNMIMSEIRAGNGVCYIDPHGDAIDKIVKMIPKERAEDVIIFDASDTERPLGLNLFEARTIEQQDLVIGEAITMLYRLYDPQHQGIVGPRFEHWFRNGALTLMADPEGATFIEVPRIFTDDRFLAEKLKFVTDPVVRNFWISEMGQTSDFHKSEVLGWFIGKFGAFMTNTTMRNIMGQPQSSLNLRDIMDGKKILLVNLSKGLIGELNMQLLGMIFISKIQMAAMSRADIPEAQRAPFTLYVDEFQNFVTENISGILSEARKYKLSMVMANQFIQQLREDIRAAVFGNVGTLISFRVGSEDGEFVGKQFEPEYSVRDVINQENLHAVCKMTINGLPSRPFTILDYFPDKSEVSDEVGSAIRELAKLKYGRPREIVDAEILARMKVGNIQAPSGVVPREKSA